MLSREHRVRTSVFSRNEKPDFLYNLPSLTIKGYKNKDKNQFAVVIPRKNTKTAVERNSIKRKVFGLVEEHINQPPFSTYIIYPKKKSSLDEIKKDLKDFFLKRPSM